jgi:hypothetical protein
MSSCRASLLAVLCIILYDCTHVPRAGCLSFNLSFSQPQSLADLDRLTYCTGDAYLTLDKLELTRRSRRTNDSTGRATYTQPVRLWDAATGEMASFTTSFDFQITLDDASTIVTPGDGGMAFLLSHHVGSGIPPGSFGGSLGLLPYATNGTGDTTMVAVEFDTYRNQQLYGDISGNHVAIDVNSLNSTAVTDTTSPTRNLTSGYKMMATVRYENVTKFLAVELTINGDTSYYVNATVDLKSYLPEHVAVGFSAATSGGGEQHQILSWSFISTLQEEQVAQAPPPPPPPPPLHQSPEIVQHPKTRSVGRTQIVISVLAAVLGVFLLACAAVLVWRHKRHKKPPNEETSDSDCEGEQRHGRAELERGVAASGPRRYAYRELAAATNNFAEDGKLGCGGFGSVYRGKLAVAGEERPVAIKMLSSESSAQGRKEFEAEVRIISRLKHRNLVRLLGWCDSRRNGLLLVYELVAKGSLDTHLHSSDDSESFLAWSER